MGDWAACVTALDVMTESFTKNPEAGPDLVCFNFAIGACAKAGQGEVRLYNKNCTLRVGSNCNVLRQEPAVLSFAY